MKVILLHDWLTGFRGGERVLEAVCEMFPEAPLYTLIHKEGSTSKIIEQRPIHTSFLNNVPGVHTHYRKFLPLFPKAVELMTINEEADLVISSSHCVIKGLQKPAGAKHLSYIHSPMRYLYDQYDQYFGPEAPFYQRLGMKCFKSYLTKWDKDSNQNVDLMVGNSAFVKKRIENYYEREADIVHPFVDLDDFKNSKETPKEDFYLMVTAFAPNKRVDLAIEAFNRLKKPLYIIGSGQQEKTLKEMANDNITFLGNLDRSEVIDHFKRAKAFIFPGVEDFGITPLESLASGTPVIARKIGGVLETLTDKSAMFFEHDTIEALEQAVKKFENEHYEKADLLERANQFSKELFQKRLMEKIEKVMKS